MGYCGCNGLLLMLISTVDLEKQHGKKRHDKEEEEEKAIWGHFCIAIKMTLT